MEPCPVLGRVSFLAFVLASSTADTGPPPAAAHGTLRGRVVTESGEPVKNARIWILELGRSERTGEEGSFLFEDVPPGSYQLLAESDIRIIANRTATVAEGRSTDVELRAELELLRVTEIVSVTGRADELLRVSDSASEGVVGQSELASRPVLRPGDLLETVPGLVATQHSGGGKANQYFVRGFNLDHGTDFRVTLDGVPVNMPSHGHGQGYADLNFLIPELVEKVSYRKGPYYAEEGDFSAAGAARFTFFDRLERPIVRISAGEFDYARALLAGSTRLAAGDLMAAFDYTHDNGPWERPDGFDKLAGLVRYTRRTETGGWRLSAQAYDGEWDSTDQIPLRAVESGALSRYGFVDPTDGGSSSRHAVWGELWRTGERSLTSVQGYLLAYDMTLFSNFTYALADPENGDQFEQRDDRAVLGLTLKHSWLSSWAGRSMENVAGVELRNDWIDNGLHATRERVRLSTTREDSIAQLGGAPFFETRIQWNPWLRTATGARFDLYRVDVTSDDSSNSGRRDDALASPKLSVVLGPFRETEIYASFGGGFHSNDARGATITVEPVSGDAAEPVVPLVRAWGYDLGIRTEAVERLHTAVTSFGLDLDSELLFIGDGGATEASRPSRRVGLEWANFYEVSDWLELDLDVAFTRARFRDDDPAARVPGALERVLSTGVTVEAIGAWSGSLRWRYFGERSLVEDDSVRAESSSFVTARLAYELPRGVRLGVEAFNLLDQEANDVEYFYASRLPGEPLEGVADVHFHPLPRRSLRFFVDWRPGS